LDLRPRRAAYCGLFQLCPDVCRRRIDCGDSVRARTRSADGRRAADRSRRN